MNHGFLNNRTAARSSVSLPWAQNNHSSAVWGDSSGDLVTTHNSGYTRGS